MQTKRNIGIDLLKIVSMLMIVTLHMLGHGGVLDNMPPMSRCYQVAWLIEIACYGAVNCYALVDYTSPTIVLGSIALLIFFVNIRVDSTKLKQVITILSGVTLGVYLIHDNGLIRNEVVAHLFEDELKNGVYKWALVKLIIVVPAVYVICSLMDLIRSKLFDCVKRVAARFCVE